jgi:Protein of unknown function (DUF3631)
MWPEMPTAVEDRAADVWEPLISVADLAGSHLHGEAGNQSLPNMALTGSGILVVGSW